MFYLGDYVICKNYGHKGRIYQKDHAFRGTQDWLDNQEVRIHPKLLEESWYHVLLIDGGSIYTYENNLELTADFIGSGKDFEFYFKSIDERERNLLTRRNK